MLPLGNALQIYCFKPDHIGYDYQSCLLFQTDDSEIRERDAKKKSQAKQYADRKRYVQTSNIQVGDGETQS